MKTMQGVVLALRTPRIGPNPVKRGRGLAVAAGLIVAAAGCLKSTGGSSDHSGCANNSECGSGLACVQGRCVQPDCTTNEDCSAGEVCESGNCVAQHTCAKNADCTAPQVCSEHACIELGPSDCSIEATTIEFGTVAVGVESQPKQVAIFNHATVPFTVTMGEIDSGVTPVFEFGSGVGAGDYVVPAATPTGSPGALYLPLVFRPTAVGQFSGTLPIVRPCAGDVNLHGVAVEHTLECGPTTTSSGSACGVDFGYVNLAARPVRQVTFTNHGSQAVQLTLTPTAGSPFTIDGEQRVFSVPPDDGTVSIGFVFSPSQLGAQPATLNFASDDPDRPLGTIALSGIGGGPSLEVTPAAIDFGQVVIDTYQLRRLTVANAGTDVAGTAWDNLLLARFQDGTWSEARPVVTGAGAGQFTLEWPSNTYTAAGLAAGASAGFRVKFTPTRAGPKQANLEIYSNDAERPTLVVPLSGEGLAAAPCDYVIKPSTINFGVVDTNRSLTLSFSIVNRATNPADICQVTMIDLNRQTYDLNTFALLNGPQGFDTSIVIPAGGSLSVPVRFAPQAHGTFVGEVDFVISNPSNPQASVALNATSDTPCLMFAPREVDFGANGVNCNSSQRTISIYNVCTSAVTVTAIDVQPGASSEFSISRKPALPVTVAHGASTDVVAQYHPVDVGDDPGALMVTLSAGAGVLVIPLQGRGAIDPVQTETFAPASKVDVLFIIDNSCSMTDKQDALARNFASLIRAANTNGIDYHIATTTVSLDSPSYECGRFVPITGSAYPRIITPSTPDKAAAFTAQVIQGSSGTGTESLIRPAYLALTPPNITGHNAGFYRDEARLAVVVMSDAADQDPLGTLVSFYENFFLSLKGMKRRNDFSFSGIIPLIPNGPAGGCSYDSYHAGQDPRVRGIIQRTGGVAEEICNPDWATTNGHIGDNAFGPRSTLFLANTPDMTVTPNPIQMTVDGLPFPELNSRGGRQWSYDAASNAIRIESNALPAMGSTVSVSYHVACL